MQVIFSLLLSLVLTPAAWAQARLPLEGYFRPGRCMPVLVDRADALIRLSAAGAVPSDVAAGRGGVVPVLMLSPGAGPLDVAGRQFPLRALGPRDRLIGISGGDPSVAGRLFSGDSIITIQLDPSLPISGPAIAWGSLDALIIDGPLDHLRRDELLTMGVAVSLRASEKPAGPWTWDRAGEYWISHPAIAGPEGSTGTERLYSPAQSWHPGQPAPLRRRIVLAGAVVSLLALATLLVRSRRWVVAVAIVGAMSIAAIETWRRELPIIRQAEGEVIVQATDVVQHDRWTYLAANEPVHGEMPIDGIVQPIVLGIAHAQQLSLRLTCAADGSQRWEYELGPRHRAAFLKRRFDDAAPPSVSATRDSPLHELARQGYLGPGMRIIGQRAGSGDIPQEAWPAVVIEAPPSPP